MKNVVYLFGAGSSKDFGMPLGDEVFKQAYRLPRLLKRSQCRTDLILVLQEADKYLERIFTKLPKQKSKYPPFEDVLTFLWDYRKSESYDYNTRKRISVFSNPGGAKEVFEVFVKLLGLTLAGSALYAGKGAEARPLTNFVKSLFSDRQNIAFISMNYDTLLDEALLECAISGVIGDFSYAIPLYDIASERDFHNPPKFLCRKSGVYLLKPHGSLNLVYCPHPHHNGFFYSAHDLIATTYGQLRCPVCGSKPKPLIIPPLYNKAEYVTANAVRTQHQVNFRASPEIYRRGVDLRIREVLASADEVVVIGYSMPPYDYDFRTIFVSSLMHNKRRKSIVLKLVTKGNPREINALRSQLGRFVGAVENLGSNGFLNYLEQQRF